MISNLVLFRCTRSRLKSIQICKGVGAINFNPFCALINDRLLNSWQESSEQSASRPRAINSNYALQIITKIDPVGVVKRRWQAKRGWQIEHHYQFLSQQKRIRKNNKINRKMNFIAAGEFKFVEGENETIKSASQKIAGEFLVFALMRQMLSQYCLLDSPSPCTHRTSST